MISSLGRLQRYSGCTPSSFRREVTYRPSRDGCILLHGESSKLFQLLKLLCSLSMSIYLCLCVCVCMLIFLSIYRHQKRVRGKSLLRKNYISSIAFCQSGILQIFIPKIQVILLCENPPSSIFLKVRELIRVLAIRNNHPEKRQNRNFNFWFSQCANVNSAFAHTFGAKVSA